MLFLSSMLQERCYFFSPHTEEAVNECLLSFTFEVLKRTISIEPFEPSAPILCGVFKFRLCNSGFSCLAASSMV